MFYIFSVTFYRLPLFLIFYITLFCHSRANKRGHKYNNKDNGNNFPITTIAL